MQEGRASDTAKISAMMRAAHFFLDAEPHILVDELAPAFCGITDAKALSAELDTLRKELASLSSTATAQAWLRSAQLSGVVRARYVEDELRQAMQRGTSQCVILGAGYDSFAYRRCKPSDAVQIFEVDYPSTQQRKLAKLAELGEEIPPNLTYVEADFENRSLMSMLRERGFRDDKPAYFWLIGVTLYLTPEAIDSAFREIATAADGSELVLDYLLPESLLDREGQSVVQLTTAIAARRGERAINYLEPGDVERRLKAAGFAHVSTFDEHQINARYFAARSDGLKFPKQLYLAKGRIDRSTQN